MVVIRVDMDERQRLLRDIDSSMEEALHRPLWQGVQDSVSHTKQDLLTPHRDTTALRKWRMAPRPMSLCKKQTLSRSLKISYNSVKCNPVIQLNAIPLKLPVLNSQYVNIAPWENNCHKQQNGFWVYAAKTLVFISLGPGREGHAGIITALEGDFASCGNPSPGLPKDTADVMFLNASVLQYHKKVYNVYPHHMKEVPTLTSWRQPT